MIHRLLPLAALLAVAACEIRSVPPPAADVAAGAIAVPPEGAAAIDTALLMRHVRVLAHDSLLGRKPGSEGETRTVAYLESEFRALGLAPGNTDGSYVQQVPLVGITVRGQPALTFSKGGARRTLRWRDDFVARTKHVAPSAALNGSELVFVGYGTEAPEFGWDDFKGVDVAGKTLVMLVNDPPLPDTSQFGGNRMTYYGRWTYKFDQAMRHKAAGVLIVHQTERAGYPFAVLQGWTAEQFDLVTPDKNMSRSAVEGWLTLEQARALFTMADLSFDSLQTLAATREFRPVPLGVTASITLRNTLRTLDSRNVMARLPGSDPALRDEYVVYTAHWDHFGVGEPVGGDSIYNGARDNATGTAALLALAKGFKALPIAPRRSILFLAVTAEEQGLLGSQHYTVSPTYPLARTVANLNMDALNTYGPTRDLTVIGLGASELDDYARQAASEQGRTLRPDPEPEKGFYYRSDHFNFAKHGVPALYLEPGVEYVGQPSDYGMKVRESYTANEYHKPADEVKPDWDPRGMLEDVRLLLTIGYRVAGADRLPEWRPGSEFRAIREQQLKSAR